jgi:para-nitrobenzyl esterase
MDRKKAITGKLDRRNFLQKSAVITSGIAATCLIKTPAFASPIFAVDAPLAATEYGQVRGYTDNGINVFKGIPYGADTSKSRFMPPLPPEKWKGIRDAMEYGASSPQQSRNAEKISEDCLFLNIFTPGLRDKKKRPVMFYIHGGAYANGSGSSPLYDGVRLCKRGDVVVVSVNHRLNAFWLFIPGTVWRYRTGRLRQCRSA